MVCSFALPYALDAYSEEADHPFRAKPSGLERDPEGVLDTE